MINKLEQSENIYKSFYCFYENIQNLIIDIDSYEKIASLVLDNFTLESVLFFYYNENQPIKPIFLKSRDNYDYNYFKDRYFNQIVQYFQGKSNSNSTDSLIYPLSSNHSHNSIYIAYIKTSFNADEMKLYDNISSLINNILKNMLNSFENEIIKHNQCDLIYQLALFSDGTTCVLNKKLLDKQSFDDFINISTPEHFIENNLNGGKSFYVDELKKALTNENLDIELRINSKDNSIHQAKNKAFHIEYPTRTSIWLGYFTIKQENNLIFKNKSFIKTIFDSITHPFYVIDINNYQIVMANSASNIKEYNSNTTCYALTHHRNSPCDSLEHPCPVTEVLRTKKPYKTNHIHYDKKGNERFVEVCAYPIKNDENKITHMIEYSIDITEQVKAEMALQGSHIKYHSIITSLNEGLILIQEDGLILECNISASRILAIQRLNIITKKINEIRLNFFDIEKNRIPMDLNPIYLSFINKEIMRGYTLGFSKNNSPQTWISVNTQFLTDDEKGSIMILSFRDITKNIHDQENIRKLSKAVEQSNNSIIITDFEGNIEYINPKYLKLTGFKKEEIIKHNHHSLGGKFVPEKEYKYIWTTIKNGNIWNGELQNKKKNDEVYWENTTISPIKDIYGKITHFLTVKEDITEKKKHLEELNLYRNQLEEIVNSRTAKLKHTTRELQETNLKLEHLIAKEQELARLKDEFTSNINHELKTPLTSILMASQYVKKRVDKLSIDKIEERMDRIIRSGQHLLELVNKLLEFSKLEAGKVSCSIEKIYISNVLKILYDTFHDFAHSKNIDLIINSDDEIFIHSDNEHLQNILNNLLSNAFKFTESGSIELKCYTEKDFVYFVIIDSGCGISPDEAESIFDRFKQGTIDNNKAPGTGIGLHMVKSLIDLHGGSIEVQSQLDVGSTFIVKLPIESKWPH